MKRRNVLKSMAGVAGITAVSGLSTATDCSGVADWSAETTYSGGDKAIYDGTLYEASWWTQGDEPGSSEWGPWEKVGSCDGSGGTDGGGGDNDGGDDGGNSDGGGGTMTGCGGVPAWDSETVYNGGEKVSYDGALWKAEWYTQRTKPGSSSWGPWKKVGSCDGSGTGSDDGTDGTDDGSTGDPTGGSLPWGNRTLTPFQGTWDTAGDWVGQTLDAPVDRVNLAFVGDPTGGQASPGWLSECQDGCNWEHVSEKADQVQTLQNNGVGVGVSIAGWDSPTLAGAADTVSELKAAYEDLLDSLGISHIDIDDENDSYSRPASVYERRHEALAQLQDERPDLTVGYTVPAGTGGIENRNYSAGKDMVRDALNKGVDLEYVNIMAMHFGSDASASLVQSAAEGTVDWLGTVTSLSEQERYNMLGITTSIDGDGFTRADTEALTDWAVDKGVGMLGFWALYSNGGQEYAETFAQGL
jgi:chitodextrinase